MPRDLHLSTLDLDLFPTVYVHGAAELVVEEGLKRIFFHLPAHTHVLPLFRVAGSLASPDAVI